MDGTVESSRARSAARVREHVPRVPDGAGTYVGVAVLVLFVIPARYSVGPAGVRLSLTLALGLIALLMWVSSILFRRSADAYLNPARWLLLLYLAFLLVSAAAAYRTPLDDVAANSLLRSLTENFALGGLALLLIDGIRGRAGITRLVGLTVVGGYFSALIALGQRVLHYNYVNLWTSVPGLSSGLSSEEVNGLLSGRATGTGTHPIEFSVACACLIPLAIVQSEYARSRRWVVFHRAGAGILVIGCLLGVSRAGFIGLVIAVLFSLFRMRPRQQGNAVAFGVVVLAIVQFGVHGTLSTLRYQLSNAGSDNSSKGRTADYGPVFDLFRQHPLTGIGLGTYTPQQNRFLDNTWLGVLLTEGILGTVVLGLLVLGGLYLSAKLRRELFDSYLGEMAGAAGVALLVLAVCAYFFDELSFHQTEGLFFVVLGILGALYALNRWQGAAPERESHALAPRPDPVTA